MIHPDIFAITCAELPDRAAALSAHLAERGLLDRTVFIRGVHGATWKLDTWAEYESGKRISAGHIGLLLAHWFAWNTALHRQDLQQRTGGFDSCRPDDYCLIIEDDAVFPADWEQQLASITTELTARFPEWELCFVGLCDSPPQCWNKVTDRIGGGDSRLARLVDPFGTHAYLVRYSALPKLIDALPAGGARWNMDQQLYQNVLRDNKINWCAVLPTIVKQRTFDYTGQGKPEWGPSCVDGSIPASQQIANAAPPKPPTDAETYLRTLALVDPYPCLYRAEIWDESGINESGRSVPLHQCALLNQPCHLRGTAVVRTRAGAAAVDCASCSKRVGDAAPASARPRMGVPDGHFNPSIAMWRGRMVLATRDSWGHSRVALWWLDNPAPDWSAEWRANPIGSYASNHPAAPRLEDPRLFIGRCPETNELRLCAAFNLPGGYPPKRVRVGYAQFAADLSGIERTVVFPSPNGNAYEKNWSPFMVGGMLLWEYAHAPEHVVYRSFPDGKIREWARTPNPLPWHGGALRGGATPVRVGDEFYAFVHGCMKRPQGNVYTMGCVVFDAAQPFRIKRQTPGPIIWPDQPGPGEDVAKRYVVWPGGAVPHAGHWHIALGIDDTYVRMVRYSFDEIESRLNDVRAEPAPLGLRDTPACRGVLANELDPDIGM